jgi:hypothetical protein
MCCGGYIGSQIGAPLEDQDLAAMPPEAQTFWHGFFGQAEQEMKAAEDRNEQQPFVPSQDLREKHFRAITEFDGSRYCPVRQLENIFDFDPPS